MEKLIITADDISISGNVMTYTRDGVVYQWNGIPTRRPCTDNMAKQFALILSIEGLESSDPVRRIEKHMEINGYRGFFEKYKA